MDGMAQFTPEQDFAAYAEVGGEPGRRTLKSAIGCVGIGLHLGRRVRLTLRPAPSGTGIVFRRTDISADILARWDLVADTRLCTVLRLPGRPEATVGTVEHVMAALAGYGVDDAVVELDGPEVPILDGSAAPFAFLLDCAGTTVQAGEATRVEVLRPVRVGSGDAWAELRPTVVVGLSLALTIRFDAEAIGEQSLALRLDPDAFRTELASARTFTMASEVEALRQAGLAQGGSLDNAVVVDGAQVLNSGGLRAPDEFVRHKLLDAVGDLALAGGRLQARFTGHRSGHQLNNRLLRALFADRRNWRTIGEAPVPAAAAA